MVLGGIFGRELTPGLEYIALMGPDGFTHVHTNAMRAGRVYGDATNLAAAAVRAPTTRRYDRNTGEVIREAVVPVRSHGEHLAVLRVGQVVRKGSLRRRVTLSPGAAALVPSAAVAMTADPPTGGVAGLGAGAVTAGVLAVWNDRRISRPIAEFNATARAVSEGDLTATVSGVGRHELAQMGFELNKVVLGLQKVIEAGAASSAAVSELAGSMAVRTGETAGAMAETARAVDAMDAGAGQVTTAVASVTGVREAVEEVHRHLGEAVEVAVAATEGLGQDAELLEKVMQQAADDSTAALSSSELISGATRSTAAGTDENAAAATDLSARSQALRELVGRLRTR